ncbi:hypothetical protein [Aquimarina algiphila]|uniref:hypothetical protein n=1 Tax=Aquimarina algiphila TaxID=2047982 RepID=UPI00232D755C|nr:hypothetical protein [Aquimarina algiphila]
MKKLNVVLLAIAFAITSVASANTNPTTKAQNVINKKVKTLLKKPSFKIAKELTAYVTITINDEGEMVVLSVDTDSEELESFIKHRINYKKVGAQVYADTKLFKLPVRLVEESASFDGGILL